MDILQELADAGAVLTDYHFVYKSWKHGPHYISPDSLLPLLPKLQAVGEGLAMGPPPDVVLGPDFGGNYLSFQAAEALARQGCDVRWVATKKVGQDDFMIEPDRGFEKLIPNKRVKITEDLLTTGGSVAKVVRLVRDLGGIVSDVSVVVNRGGVTAEDLDVPELHALASVNFLSVEHKDCLLCKQRVQIVEDPGLGHGAEFKLKHPDYPGGYIKLLG